MGFERPTNDQLSLENFRGLIAQIVREELAKLFAFQHPPDKVPEFATGNAMPKLAQQGEKAPSVKITNNWLTHSEAAAYLRTTSAVLYKLSSLRKIKFSKRGKRNYYKIEHLEQYLAEGEIKTRDEVMNEIRLKGKLKIINH